MPDELPGMWEEADFTGGQDADPDSEEVYLRNLTYDYPKTNSGPKCSAEESGYLDSTSVFCPFASDYTCTAGCPTNRERICILGEE